MSRQQSSSSSDVKREELRLITLDFKATKEEMKRTIEAQTEKRNALRIGNDCLRHMTHGQFMMPVTRNAKIFAERPRAERVSMKHVSLSNSIHKNDGILFRYGKRLMIMDQMMGQTKLNYLTQQRKLEDAIADREYFEQERERQSQMFLHKQVKAMEYDSRLNAARMIHMRLEKIYSTLQIHAREFPSMIIELERKIKSRTKQLDDFKTMRDKSRKYMHVAERQLKPLNKELQVATVRFERAIANEKAEIEELKKTPISKFLAEREQNAFNYTSGSSIEEMKIKARNQTLVTHQERAIALLDAMLVSDVSYLVNCINDQEDVNRLLKAELAKRLNEQENYKIDIARLAGNHQVLKFDDRRCHRMRQNLLAAKKELIEERNRYAKLDEKLRTQDQLCSDISLSLHALFEKLRPIKLPEDEVNHYQWDLLTDTQHVILKLSKMTSLCKSSLAKVTRVKPMMLNYFKEKRVPPDSIRVDPTTVVTKIVGFDSFEADQPGYITREMLKQRCEEAVGITKKNKKNK